MYYIDQAIEKFKKNPATSEQNREPSVLEKLLKIDKHVAVVMALDMMMAGVDTVSTFIFLTEISIELNLTWCFNLLIF